MGWIQLSMLPTSLDLTIRKLHDSKHAIEACTLHVRGP